MIIQTFIFPFSSKKHDMQFGNNSEKKNGFNILDLEASTLKSVNQGFCWLENKNDKRKKARFIKRFFIPI